MRLELRPKLTALAVGLAVSLSSSLGLAADHVKVGIMSGDAEIIWEQVKQVAAKDDLDVELVVFGDYVLPNAALDAGEIDANAFQHEPYLDNQNRTKGYDIVTIGKTIVSPIGLYSNRVKSVADLPDGAKIGIPNDPSNGGRGLLLLAAEKLIALREGVGITPSVIDVTDNPKNLEFVEIDAAQLPRSLDDLDAAVINTNYALEAGLTPRRDAIAVESEQDNPYGNIIAARRQDKDRADLVRLVKAFQAPEIRKFINDRFDGAIIPVF